MIALALAACARGLVGGPGDPELLLTDVPDPGSYALLHGEALHVDPTEWGVVACLGDGASWRVRPSSGPARVRADGTWSVDHTEEPGDELADRVLAFLVPAELEPAGSGPDLPAALADPALPHDGALRSDGTRLVAFSGRAWEVRRTDDAQEPGPNLWVDDREAVRVDADGWLHLALVERGGTGAGAEIVSLDPPGYGDLTFTLETPARLPNPYAVLGLFVRDSHSGVEANELDVELARWADPVGPDAQFVVQPWPREGNLHKFELGEVEGPTTHAMAWRPDRVDFSTSLGRGWPPAEEDVIEAWPYTGGDVLVAGREQIHLNLWLFRYIEPPPEAWDDVEVVLSSAALRRTSGGR